MASTWIRFVWDLKSLPAELELSKAPLVLRAVAKEDLSSVIKVVRSSFSMDTGWADIHKQLLDKIVEKVEASFEGKESPGVVLQHGQRIIGCSILNLSEEADNNLVTGPCILHEYRSRGLGSALLGASLLALREAGLRRALGLTRGKTVCGRYLYPKFGGTSEPWTSDLDVRPRLAA